jgi:sec-independent protein translocase protein TatA
MSFPALPVAIFNLSGMELVVILAILLLLFGGTKLPSLARGLGQSVKEFKKAAREDDEAKPADSEAAKSSDAKKPDQSKPTHGTN